MRAAVIKRYGKPTVLQIGDMVDKHPQAGEVKIQVCASSVNPIDCLTRSGSLIFMSGMKFPKVLGSDFSGVIVECGSGVMDYAPGDEVYGFTNAATKGGAYGEYLCCSTLIIARKPVGLTFLEAGVTPLAASTAYQGLYYEGGMTPGMHVCITGATGGVGHYAVQIAKAANCTVTGICHSRNEELAYQLGCDNVISYDKVALNEIDRRFDLIFDAVAKFGYFSIRHTLKTNGAYVSTVPSLTTAIVPLIPSAYRRHKVCYFWASSNTADLNLITQLADQGELKPFIETVFPLEEAAKAHALSETRKTRGKIGIAVKSRNGE